MAAHLPIPTKYQMSCMIVVHRGNFTVKYCFINDPSSAEIEHLLHQLILEKNESV